MDSAMVASNRAAIAAASAAGTPVEASTAPTLSGLPGGAARTAAIHASPASGVCQICANSCQT